MADAPYLVALALLEVGGKRALPLSGKALSVAAAEASDPGDEGRALALELMLSVWQRSDDGVVEMPLQLMSDQLPLIKSSWISSGHTADFLQQLEALATRGRQMVFAKYEPVSHQRWP